MNIYETDELLEQYLLFHYGSGDEVQPPSGAGAALHYPQRCITECVDAALLPSEARALDLGCAVGRSTFELARICSSALGIDFSQRFIDAAERLRRDGELPYRRVDEGALTTPLIARAPTGVLAERVSFEVGDATQLRPELGAFDVVLMANLIDRLAEPQRCLAQLPALVKSGGQLIITSPYTWLEEFTPRANWLGGFLENGAPRTTLDGLRVALDEHFELRATRELPFLIREHARKFQLSIAEASIWRRR